MPNDWPTRLRKLMSTLGSEDKPLTQHELTVRLDAGSVTQVQRWLSGKATPDRRYRAAIEKLEQEVAHRH